jgi:2'-5' RNA ligase
LKQLRTIAIALAIVSAPLAVFAQAANPAPSAVTAIDIAIDPSAAMSERAEAANARLVAAYPKGFAFGPTYHPHVTLLQRYVRTADLPKVYAAVAPIVAAERASGFSLTSAKYAYSTSPPTGVRSMLFDVPVTPALLDLQQKLIAAVAPYAVETGTAAAFFTTASEPDVKQSTIDYVTTFVSKASGANFMPHVTLGLATPDLLARMAAEPFSPIAFAPVSVTVYQLGNYGTARNRLQSWPLAP